MKYRAEQKSLSSLQSAYNEFSSSNSSGVSNNGVWCIIYSNGEPFNNVPVFQCGFKPLIYIFTIILSAITTVYCSFLFLQSNTFNCLCHSTLGSIQSASLLPFQVYSTFPLSEITKNRKHYRTVWLLCGRGSVIVT